jgi:hypothetical protein
MDGFEIGNGSNPVMFLPYAAYGALYQSGLVERAVQLVSADQVESAWSLVADAWNLAGSLECSWCGSLGLHDECWQPRPKDG